MSQTDYVTALQTLATGPGESVAHLIGQLPASYKGTTIRANPMLLVQDTVRNLFLPGHTTQLNQDVLPGASVPQFHTSVGTIASNQARLTSTMSLETSLAGLSGTPTIVATGANYKGMLGMAPGASSTPAHPYTVLIFQTIGKATTSYGPGFSPVLPNGYTPATTALNDVSATPIVTVVFKVNHAWLTTQLMETMYLTDSNHRWYVVGLSLNPLFSGYATTGNNSGSFIKPTVIQ